jgi:hypothetical protein
VSKKEINKQRTGVEKHNAKVDENYKSLKEKAPLVGGATAGGLAGGMILGSGALSSKKEEDKSKE